MNRNKTNSILISRAPLDYMDGTSYEKPRMPTIPGWQFWIITGLVAYALITLFTLKGLKHAVMIDYEMRVESRLIQIEADHQRLKNLLYME